MDEITWRESVWEKGEGLRPSKSSSIETQVERAELTKKIEREKQ